MTTNLVEGQPMLLTECIKLGTPIIVPNVGELKNFYQMIMNCYMSIKIINP